jgi:hypothetical protein
VFKAISSAAVQQTTTAANCWICGDPANSGEHKAKKSDLKAVFLKVSDQRPIHYHDGIRLNRKVMSLNANLLKWRDCICHYCNTTRTQPHDLAWEALHAELRRRLPMLKEGSVVRANSIFPQNTARAMLHVHLYFVKALGCAIVMEKAALDIAPFSKAIISEMAHPDFYLELGLASGPSVPVIQASPIHTFQNPDGSLIQATWFYNAEGLVVEARLIPGALAQKVAAKQSAWHPRLGTNRLRIVSIRG